MTKKNVGTDTGTRELRNFGFIVGIGFAVFIGLLPPIFHKTMKIWPIALGLALIFLGVFLPRLLKYPYKIWMYVGAILGWINTRIILFIFFYIVLTPIAVIKKIFGKDSLNRNWDSSLSSYRKVNNPEEEQSLERPF